MLDMGVVDGPNVTDLPILEDNMEVVCLSQDAQRLSNPLVGARDFVIVDPTTDSSRKWTGTRVRDFIKDLGNEMNRQAVKMLGDDAMYMVVYEAYKLLEEDLTILMQSILQMKVNAKIVKHLKYILILITCLSFVQNLVQFQLQNKVLRFNF